MTSTAYLDGRVRVLAGDLRDCLPLLADNSVDSVVCDPPYHLTSTAVRELVHPSWNGNTKRERQTRKAGFMGMEWDGGGIAFDPATWAEVYRVIKPGGHMLAFSGTRTYHRMACAIEDAGFEIRDQFGFAFGTGFPKSLDIAKAIDKARPDNADWLRVGTWLRAQREARGLKQKEVAALWPSVTGGLTGCVANWELGFSCPKWGQWIQLKERIGFGDDMDAEVWRLNGRKGEWGNERDDRIVTEPGRNAVLQPTQRVVSSGTPVLDAARQWEGWGTALKPAWEPIAVGSKPVTVTQHFAMIVDELTAVIQEACAWSNVSAHGAAAALRDTRVKSQEAASSVRDGARMRSLESIGLAPSAARSSTFSALVSVDLIRTRGCSALSHVRPHGSADKQETQTQHGAAADILTRLMAISTSVMLEGMSESIASSWHSISADILAEASKFTISTASRLTTALRTLNCSLLPNITEGTGGFRPSWEPLALARKPLSEPTIAANVLRWGTGALNIDGCRVPASGRPAREIDPKPTANGAVYAGRREAGGGFDGGSRAVGATDLGRFTANLILSVPEDEYLLRSSATAEQKRALYRWMSENA